MFDDPSHRAIGPAGLAYNPNVVPADQAPKTWEEAIDPKWTDGITVKLSTSGLQHVSWFELRGLYGPDYWKKFGELKPKGFDSYVQQFDRLVNQQDKIIHTAQYAGYLEWKKKGAPVGFNSPAAGLPATPETWGFPTDCEGDCQSFETPISVDCACSRRRLPLVWPMRSSTRGFSEGQ